MGSDFANPSIQKVGTKLKKKINDVTKAHNDVIFSIRLSTEAAAEPDSTVSSRDAGSSQVVQPQVANIYHLETEQLQHVLGSWQVFVTTWLNNCKRELPFTTVSYEFIAGYKCSSEFTFEQEKQYFVNSSSSSHSMIM